MDYEKIYEATQELVAPLQSVEDGLPVRESLSVEMFRKVFREAETGVSYYSVFDKSVTEPNNSRKDYGPKSSIFNTLVDAYRELQNQKHNGRIVLLCYKDGRLTTNNVIELSSQAFKLTQQGEKELDELEKFIVTYRSTLGKEGTKEIRLDQKNTMENNISKGQSEHTASTNAIKNVTKNPSQSQWTKKES